MKILKNYIFLMMNLYLSWAPLQAQTIGSSIYSYDQTQMVQIRKISVALTGAVRNPGTYIVSATDRVDRAIHLSNLVQLSSSQADRYSLDELYLLSRNEKLRRNVLLQRRTGEIIKVDIPKYYATKDERWNPVLSDGDMIFVPRFDGEKNLFAVYGGVNVPGQIEYSEGDRITDAIQLAYGFTPRAIIDSIILYRYNEDNQSLKEQLIYWIKIQDNDEENIKLQPGDRIIVLEREELREDYHVTISGEVHFPGVYPITRDKTKLSSIILKAGGITQYASLKSALLYRNEILQTELSVERIMSMRGNTSPEDSSNFNLENELRLRRGVVNIDFEKLLFDHDTTHDVVMNMGDYIVIPSINKTVYVFGQVVNPGSISFVTGETIEYYIKKSGGYTEHARISDLMIIKRASRQWLTPSQTNIEEGDYIWVPKEPDRPFSYYLNMIGQTASILSVALSVIILAIQVK